MGLKLQGSWVQTHEEMFTSFIPLRTERPEHALCEGQKSVTAMGFSLFTKGDWKSLPLAAVGIRYRKGSQEAPLLPNLVFWLHLWEPQYLHMSLGDPDQTAEDSFWTGDPVGPGRSHCKAAQEEREKSREESKDNKAEQQTLSI